MGHSKQNGAVDKIGADKMAVVDKMGQLTKWEKTKWDSRQNGNSQNQWDRLISSRQNQ